MEQEEILMFCDECGIKLNESNISPTSGVEVCEPCQFKQMDHSWCIQVSFQELIDLLNMADRIRMQAFYISFIGGKTKYLVAREAYPSVFCVYTTREELVTLISERSAGS